MTATPINNQLLDVYHQLSLITAGNDSHFASMGIHDIYKHIRNADREKNLWCLTCNEFTLFHRFSKVIVQSV